MPKKRISILVVALVASIFIAQTVMAQSNKPSAPSSGLRISPTRTELSLDKGKSSFIRVTLKNVSGADITAKAEVNDFEPDGESGDPRILVNQTEPTGSSVRPFLSNTKDVKLKKDETKNITIDINIPKDYPSGAYYGVLRYSAVPEGASQDAPGKVALTASVATLVMIEVPGNITQQIQLNDIFVYQKSNDRPHWLFFKPPSQAGIKITNTGTGFTKPFGRVSVKRNLGNKEVFSYELNSSIPRNNVLPQSSRIFKDDIRHINLPGRYTITAGVSHDSSGEVLTKQISFWYIPIWLVIVLAVLLLLILVGIGLLIRKIHKSSRVHLRNR